METMPLEEQNEEAVVAEVCGALRSGHVIVYPTDTLYGLGADVRNQNAIKRLFMIKKRPAHKPLPVFVENVDMAKSCAFIDKKQERILEKFWPGAVTVIFEKKQMINSLVSGGRETVGLRIPDSPFCLRLIHEFGGPITGTSANISGESGSNSLAPILEQFKAHSRFPDLIIDAGTLPESQPSTIVDCTTPHPKILRIGPVNPEQLRGILAL